MYEEKRPAPRAAGSPSKPLGRGPIRRRAALALAALLPAALAAGVARPIGGTERDEAPDDAPDDRYATPLPPPTGPMRVFHLGHSLVGRDMPAMLAALAGPGHHYDSQLGWGASLKAHWGDAPIAGFAEENDHPRFRAAAAAVDSGDYDAVVLTEMVEIRDAIRFMDAPGYLRRWAARAEAARPEARVFLYETWHRLDDPEGWLDRIDRDLARAWDGVLIDATRGLPRPVHLVPAGQVLARYARAAAAKGGAGGVAVPADLFADEIHLSDLGAYLVALTHYAVLYQRSPVGLPHALSRADGTPAAAPDAATARLMQQVAWDVVTTMPETGVPQRPSSEEPADG